MELTANVAQTVATNQNVVFTDTAVRGNSSMIHREGSGIVMLRGLTSGQCRARFKVFFNGNIAVPEDGTAGEISVAIALEGEPLMSTIMTVTPAAVNNYFNVSSEVYIDVPAGACATISVENTTAQSISVSNANLIVERVA